MASHDYLVAILYLEILLSWILGFVDEEFEKYKRKKRNSTRQAADTAKKMNLKSSCFNHWHIN